MHFPEIVVTVGPKAVDIDANGAALSGDSASDLRKCIDKANCPDSRLEGASTGDGNGQVDADEVDDFESNAIAGLNVALAFAGGSFAEFGDAIKAIASIDGQTARIARVESFEIEGAEGSIGSTFTIHVSFTIRVEFPNVGGGNRHAVSVARAESGLELADRIVVQPASGWKIKEGSIQPEKMRGYYSDGRISGSQKELEGPEPLTFDLQKGGGLSFVAWFGIISLLLVLAGLGLWAWSRRRKV